MADGRQYQELIDRASFYYGRHGMVDLVDLSKADELGVSAETFTRDVSERADAYSKSLGQ